MADGAALSFSIEQVAEFGNWDGERLGLLLHHFVSEMRLGSLGTVQSFLFRCN